VRSTHRIEALDTKETGQAMSDYLYGSYAVTAPGSYAKDLSFKALIVSSNFPPPGHAHQGLIYTIHPRSRWNRFLSEPLDLFASFSAIRSIIWQDFEGFPGWVKGSKFSMRFRCLLHKDLS
jgi:hypothetical protein